MLEYICLGSGTGTGNPKINKNTIKPFYHILNDNNLQDQIVYINNQ
jgi:hypothetical protein